MFNKKRCKRCGEKNSNKARFCSACGFVLENGTSEDYGMLGKEDSIKEEDILGTSIFGGFSEKMISKMMGSAFKMLEKELQKGMNENSSINNQRTNFRLMINGKEIPINNPKKMKEKRKVIKSIPLPSRILKGFAKLKKEEPKTLVKRLGDKIIYEIEIPGVKSIENISITKLENSIEIKALAKGKAYLKVIPISLPVVEYFLEKEKLILELAAGE